MLSENEKSRLLKTKRIFEEHYSTEPTDFFKSTGRLEIIGNHLDYNGGHVINSSVDNLNIMCSAKKLEGNDIRIISEGYPDLCVNLNQLEFDVKEKETTKGLVKGILARMKEVGVKIGAFEAVIDSNIVKGGGVSSSAAYSVLFCKIISYYYNNDSVDTIEIAKISRYSENNYFGKGSGLQDQIGCCSKGFSITDYRDQQNPIVSSYKVDLGDYDIVLIDSKTPHDDSQSAFDSIVNDMKEVAMYFNKPYLIDIAYEDFMKEYNKGDRKETRAWNRARHFFEENTRVLGAAECLKNNDVKSFLKYFAESSMSSEYLLKSIVLEGQDTNNLKEALHYGREIVVDGAVRVHGGGFGGTMICFINKHEKKSFEDKMAAKFGRDSIIEVYPCSNPLRKIDVSELN